MIYVDAPSPRGAPWPGGRSSHLLSDASLQELLEFGCIELQLDREWIQLGGSVWRFDIAPRQHRLALARGAQRLDRTNMRDVLARARAAGLTGWPKYNWRAWEVMPNARARPLRTDVRLDAVTGAAHPPHAVKQGKP